MPFNVKVEAPILRNTFSGTVTKAEFVEFAKELKRMERSFERIPDRLTDLTAVTEWESGFIATLNVTHDRQMEVFPNKFKSAIVAPTAQTFGIARMFQSLNDNPQIKIQIFKNCAEAEDWLA
jgi:hypothetical protein